MRKIVIVLAAVAVAVMAASVISLLPPDYDAIIANRDCNAVMMMSDSQALQATTEQLLALGALAIDCSLETGGMLAP